MKCPRCEIDLLEEKHHGIEVDHCSSCNGRWLDHSELSELEATIPSTENERRATIQYVKRESDLKCRVCSSLMLAFNYRAYDLELDTCEDEHGFWMDAGETGKVRDIIEERVRGLSRAASSEEAWGNFLDNLGGGGSGSVWDQITGVFRGRKK